MAAKKKTKEEAAAEAMEAIYEIPYGEHVEQAPNGLMGIVAFEGDGTEDGGTPERIWTTAQVAFPSKSTIGTRIQLERESYTDSVTNPRDGEDLLRWLLIVVRDPNKLTVDPNEVYFIGKFAAPFKKKVSEILAKRPSIIMWASDDTKVENIFTANLDEDDSATSAAPKPTRRKRGAAAAEAAPAEAKPAARKAPAKRTAPEAKAPAKKTVTSKAPAKRVAAKAS